MLSENISVHTRSPLRLVSPCSVASGTAPMPACRVDPSLTRSATRAPMRAEASSIRLPGALGSGASASTRTSTRSRSSSASPYVHGIWSLTWATTSPPRRFADSIAAGSTLTSTPSETLPSRGRLVCSTTRSGGRAVPKSVGTIESRDGT